MVFSSCGTFYCLDPLMDEYIASNQGNKRQKITKHMNQFVDIITFSFIPYSSNRAKPLFGFGQNRNRNPVGFGKPKPKLKPKLTPNI